MRVSTPRSATRTGSWKPACRPPSGPSATADNALAETVNGLYKAELVFWEGPWKGADDLELATLGWVDWFNHTRLHSALDYRPPAEVESEYYRQIHSTERPLVGEPAL